MRLLVRLLLVKDVGLCSDDDCRADKHGQVNQKGCCGFRLCQYANADHRKALAHSADDRDERIEIHKSSVLGHELTEA